MALSWVRLFLLLLLFLWLLLLLFWLMALNAIGWIFETGVAFEDNKDCTMVLVDFLWTVPCFGYLPAGPYILTTEDVVHSRAIPGKEITYFN